MTEEEKHRAGDLMFLGPFTASGSGLPEQASRAIAMLKGELAKAGMMADRIIKLTAYYVAGNEGDRTKLLRLFADSLMANSHAVISLVPVPSLPREHGGIQLEAVCYLGVGELVSLNPDGFEELPRPLSHAVRVDELIFTGLQSAYDGQGNVIAPNDLVSQSHTVMDRLVQLVEGLGGSFRNVLKINNFYVAGGDAAAWEQAASVRAGYFEEPGPAPTGIPLQHLYGPGVMTAIEVCAIADEGRSEIEYSWPEGHWDWTVHLPYRHAAKYGKVAFVGGQVSLDPHANVIDPGQMLIQASASLANIEAVLGEVGLSRKDVAKLNIYYKGPVPEADRQKLRDILAGFWLENPPAMTEIPLPYLCYEDMDIEIEAIAGGQVK